jgi:adenylate cyclase
MKKISPVVVVGLLLTFLCLSLFVSGPAFIQAVSNYAYDAFIRRVHQSAKSDRVVIVDLDDASLQKYGQWPWPRYRVARLTESILDAGAAVVGFDIVFAERDRTSPVVLEQDLSTNFSVNIKIEGVPAHLTDFDLLFANVLKKGKTILGCSMMPSDKAIDRIDERLDPYFRSHINGRTVGRRGDVKDLKEYLMQSQGMAIAIPELNEASKTAFFNAVPDSDSIVRSNPLVWGYGDRIYPSLALEAVMLYMDFTRCTISYDEQGLVDIRLKDLVIPTDKLGRMMVNYRTIREDSPVGFSSSFPTYSAGAVLEGKFPPNALKGKIVFVGASAVGLKDIKASPLTQFFSGVEVHATIVDNILANDMLSNPSWMVGVNSLAIVLMGIFLTIFINRGRSWLSFLVSVAMILLAIKMSLILLESFHLVFIPAWVILSIIVIYPVLTMIKFWQEELQKKRVRDMFGTMVSPTVLHYLENHPGSFSLSGQKREASMFFSDVAGFTTISETLQPEQLSHLLNSYLSPMTNIIMERGGYVDKYEGDAIMAEWGVPYPMEDHAAQACLAALEQQEKLAELRPMLKQQYGKEIWVRMGINSGSVTAGNMGSDKRFQYTVMGDAVNQAARLEPVNKDYGTRIIIGETTYEEAKGIVEARLIDKLIVKGKTTPICIYELLARKGQLTPEKRDLMDLYQEGLTLYWERDWEKALACLERALALDPGDGPSAIIRSRIIEFQKTPPPENWTGEYRRMSKD